LNLDPDKLIVLFVIAMMVLGPKRLPEAARTLARWLAEVRKYTSSVRREMRDLLGETADEGVAVRNELRKVFAEPREAIEAGAREVRTWSSGSASPSLPETGPASAVSVPDDPSLN